MGRRWMYEKICKKKKVNSVEMSIKDMERMIVSARKCIITCLSNGSEIVILMAIKLWLFFFKNWNPPLIVACIDSSHCL